MNDARLFLNTKEGLSAALDAFSPEDGQRLVQNMQQLEKYLGARTESETPFSESFFNGISQARMSGALTDTQAETALKVVAGAAQGENVTESRYGATQSAESDDMRNAKSLSWVLNASDSTFKDTPEAMAVNNAITATDKAGNYMNYYAPASKADDYRQDAVQDFLSDGQAHAHRAGAMQGDGSFVPGYNFAPSEDNISQAPMQYAQELLRSNQTPEDFNISKLIDATDQQTPASFLSRVFSWGKQAPTLETDKQEKLHTAAYVPHEIYQPLINAGLTQEGGRIKDGVEHLRAVAPSYSVSISTEVLENDYKEVKQGLEGLPSISDVFKKP